MPHPRKLHPEEARREAKLLSAARTLHRMAEVLEGLPAYRAHVVDALAVDQMKQEMERQLEGIRQELTRKPSGRVREDLKDVTRALESLAPPRDTGGASRGPLHLVP